ncbi:MAG TPA: sigma-70 family RNA polymerase sigma factor [Candidatus Tidjanibacter faecipullorum]|uniref:Sigma-70 family RNA polymerase sigma factor n=1 Tax=Candidatus Tidjanibacter faecipullorum TaxID=2838766 RepID=A0A9D2DEI6_9BACT|nr:sigma-70 family RNA polymerase sigma factor [Candidatus Tidjanibacter faecipullorum]
MNKTRSALSDQQLLSAYLSGDQHAISILIERHSKRVLDYIRMMVKNDELADDIYQETFIKVVRFIDDGRYTDNGKFLSWVLRIAHNQVIDYFRQTKQQNNLTEADAGYDILNTKKLADASIEDRMVSEQTEADLRKLVDNLPAEQKEVVLMRYFGEMSFKEIAEQTNVSINTALGRMRYALINLRKMIKQNQLALV